MSKSDRSRVSRYYSAFFWMGVAMTLACVTIILAGNTEMFYRLERSSIPLSWVFGGVAILEFLAAEYCHRSDLRRHRPDETRAHSDRELEFELS